MNWFDWLMVLIPVAVLIWIGVRTQHYLRGVSGFLTGERCAGRYLLAVADGSAGMGLISVMAFFEMYYKSGFAISFWSQFASLVTLAVALTGFVSYRFRETRAMTMAQFFEMRYSRGVRIVAGFVAFLSGLINYALFPAVGGRFFIYYCGLPESITLGGVAVSSFGLIMALALGGALFIVLLGGQITTMVTDCMQGIFSYFIYIGVIIGIFAVFSIADFQTVALARPEGMSFFNPYNIGKLSTFNILYVMIGLFAGVYGRNAWLGNQGYMTAATSPHEQKMAGLLGTWRAGFVGIMITLIVLGAYTLMHHAAFADQGAKVTAELAERIHFDSVSMTETLRNQMLVPLALRQILPHGLIGLFCALMLFLMVSTDTTYLHSWGVILGQDIILPLRGEKPISAKKQLWLIRGCIVFVAVFAWFFSFYFGQVDYIFMFMAATGTIWMGGAGCLILGGLYTRRGTKWGAYTAMTIGVLMGIGGFLLIKYWETGIHPWCAENIPEALEAFRLNLAWLGEALPFVDWETSPERFAIKFPVSATEIYALTILLAIAGYTLVSLLTCRRPFDLDRLLHRGKYALEPVVKTADKPGIIQKMVGITSEYTVRDKALAWSVFGWTCLSMVIFGFQFFCNTFLERWTELTWFKWFCYYSLPLDLAYGAVTTVWFTWGGSRDLKRLFHRLKQGREDSSDNGMVHVDDDDGHADTVDHGS